MQAIADWLARTAASDLIQRVFWNMLCVAMMMGQGRAPHAAKVAGALSLVFWIGVVYFVRMTGFTLVQGGV